MCVCTCECTFLHPLGMFSANLSAVVLTGSSLRRPTSCPSASSKDFGTAVSTTSEICDVTYNEIDECYQSGTTVTQQTSNHCSQPETTHPVYLYERW